MGVGLMVEAPVGWLVCWKKPEWVSERACQEDLTTLRCVWFGLARLAGGFFLGAAAGTVASSLACFMCYGEL